MDYKIFIKAVILSFAFIFCYEWAFHCQLLNDAYMKTAHVWRPQEDVESLFGIMLLSQLLFATVFVILFEKINNEKTLNYGIATGAILGLFMGVMMLSCYVYLPIPFSLAAMWLAGAIIEGVGLGVLLSLFVFKK